MSENQDITRYFNEDQSNKSMEVFDQIAKAAGSNDNQDKSDTFEKAKPEKDNEEPVICKIFQVAGEADAGSVFDMIGTVETDLGETDRVKKQYKACRAILA